MKKNYLFFVNLNKTGLLFSILLMGVFIVFPTTNTTAQSTDDFVITVKTDNPGSSSNNQFTIPTTGSGYNYNVDCNNDGIDEATGVTGNYTCTYTTPGTYTIRIKRNDGGVTGTVWNGFPRIYFNNSGDKDKILSVNQWGKVKWTSMESSFFGCSNLNSAPVAGGTGEPDWATDIPDLSNVTSMQSMFNYATTFNQPVGNWNTSNIKSMKWLFANAKAFNQPVGSWNTSNVEIMYSMFYGADYFNQPIGNWNTSNVTTMAGMFRYTKAFNQPIGNWNTSSVTDMYVTFAWAEAFNQPIGNWNTSSVKKMRGMFAWAEAFNQPIGNWNTANVTNTELMFWEAQAFNQNLGSWDVTSLTVANDMFKDITLSTNNYDALLIGWGAQNLKSKVFFSGGNSKYCMGENARNNMINNDNWTITDAGKVTGCVPVPLSDTAIYLLIALITLFMVVKLIKW